MKSKQTQTPKREVRTYTASQPMTVRTDGAGNKTLEGYAVVFSSESCDLGGFVEVCSPHMLDRTLKESPDVLALRDHKQEMLLGRTTAGTLKLETDSKGLAFTITLPNTAIGQDTAENVRIGNLSGVSFGFTTQKDEWVVGADNKVTRTLLDVDLFEISPTSFPAYKTSVNVRSCPTVLRSMLTRSDNEDGEDDDNEEAENENGCQCDCPDCRENNCENCSNQDCDDSDCISCPMQDDTRCDRLRLKRLFALRMN